MQLSISPFTFHGITHIELLRRDTCPDLDDPDDVAVELEKLAGAESFAQNINK